MGVERDEIDGDDGELLAEAEPAPLSGVLQEGVTVVEAMVCQGALSSHDEVVWACHGVVEGGGVYG